MGVSDGGRLVYKVSLAVDSKSQKTSLAQKLKEETQKVQELNNKVEELEKQNKMLNEKMDLILKKLGGK